jgi:hypothetical protein
VKLRIRKGQVRFNTFEAAFASSMRIFGGCATAFLPLKLPYKISLFMRLKTLAAAAFF